MIVARRILTALWVLVTLGAAADPQSERAIAGLMAQQFDRPEQRLEVGPVVVVADHAIAGWSQGDMGGRALLRRKGRDWQIVLCSGDQLKSAETLRHAGVPATSVQPLVERLAEAESRLPKERLAQLSKFEGIVMIEGGHHPPQHHGPARMH